MQEGFTELSDSQWQILEKILDSPRKRKHSLRIIFNAILWINRTGAQWRMLDSKYPPWSTVYYYFKKWVKEGLWEQALDFLTEDRRKTLNREPSPSLLAIDSQSVRLVPFVSEDTGIDGGKLINGRKRTILVDKLGYPYAIIVTAANVSDNAAGILAMEQLRGKVPRLEKIAADAGYKKTFVEYAKNSFNYEVEIAQKPESAQGFIPEKNRWQVERSFSWINARRRLFRDVEKSTESAVAMIQIAFISFLINFL